MRVLILLLTILITSPLSGQLRSAFGIWNKGFSIVTGDNVNVRSKPATDSKVIDKVGVGQLIQVVEVDKEFTYKGLKRPFYKILYTKEDRDIEGYIWSGYLSQHFIQTNDDLIYLKEEKSMKEGMSRLVSIYAKNSGLTLIGEAELYETLDIKLRVLEPRNLKGVKRVLELYIIDGGIICEGQHTIILYLETINDNWVTLPWIHSFDAEEGVSIEKYIFPNEPGGQKDKIVVARIKYGNHTDVAFKMKKQSFYEWDGSELKKRDITKNE